LIKKKKETTINILNGISLKNSLLFIPTDISVVGFAKT